MGMSIPINAFDRGKPFYPIVMNYLVLLIGFKDISAKGAIKEIQKHLGINKELNISKLTDDFTKKSDVSEKDAIDLYDAFTKLLGPLELKTEFQDNYIRCEVDEIANDLLYNFPYLARFIMYSAGSLLILAHEFSKGKSWHDQGPLWEFLRHCRNAAAHGGFFTLQGKDPCKPAVWGHFRIERTLQGTPLFKDEKDRGLLSPGDPIRLLWDIEQAYPGMRA